MIEKTIDIEIEDLVDIYGVNNENISLLIRSFPHLRITVRGDQIRVMGHEEQIEEFINLFSLLLQSYQKYNRITEDDIVHLLENKDRFRQTLDFGDKQDDIILYGKTAGLSVQKRLIRLK